MRQFILDLLDPSPEKPSTGRFCLLWSVVVLSPIMIGLTAAGLFPAAQISTVLGVILGAPALVQAMHYVRGLHVNFTNDPSSPGGCQDDPNRIGFDTGPVVGVDDKEEDKKA